MFPNEVAVGLFFTDREGRATFVNKRWCEMAGMDAASAMGDGWVAALHPDDRERVGNAWNEAISNHADFRGEYRFQRPDGEVVWIQGTASPLSDEPDAGYTGACLLLTEQRRAEARMRLYETILSTSPDFAYIFDKDHRAVYANESLLRMWGRTWENTIGKNWQELGYEPWHAEMHDREMETVMRTRQQWRAEVPFTGADGLRVYDYIFMPVIGENGEAEGIAGTTRDVTDRKRSEESARLLSELAGQLAPLTTEEEIIRCTLKLMQQHFNPQHCYFVECLKEEDLIRVGPNEVRGDTPTMEGYYVISDFGGEEWWDEYSKGDFAVEDVRTHPLTIHKVESYQRVGVMSFAVQPYKRTGPWTTVLAMTDDRPRKWTAEEMELLENIIARVWPLVEQARSMESLRNSQRRLALLAEAGRMILEVDSLADMLQQVAATTSGHLQSDVFLTLNPGEVGKNPVVEFSIGLAQEEIDEIGNIFFGSVLKPQDVKKTRDLLGSVFEKSGIIGSSCHPLLVGDELLGMMIFASRIRTVFSADELEFLATLSQYVTMAYVRHRLLENLRESDRRKDQFLATLAHELRNPLSPILTGLDVMKRSQGDLAVVGRVTGIIERQTAQMAYLIDDLLDMSRVNTGKIVLKKTTTSFAEILNSAIEASQPLVDTHTHTLEVSLPDSGVQVEVDASRISQVVSNLLSNSAKYTPQGGHIRLEAGVTGGDAWVKVRDNGIGIEPEDQQSIFDLFQQTATGSTDGLGIGLTLVKSLVELHGGSVSLFSEGRTKGSEFCIHLPDCVTTPLQEAQAQHEPSAPSPRKRVLVVDDGKNAADMLALFFRLEGMDVEVAYDGQQGLDKARAFDPHLVMMDLGMPVMDGLEAAHLMRAENIRAKLIALSGWGRDEDKRRTSEAGFDHHLVKPVCPDDIRVIMERFLGD